MDQQLKTRDWCTRSLAALCAGSQARTANALLLAIDKMDLGQLNELVYDVGRTDATGLDLMDELVAALQRERFQR
jgi:hypothetical protein